MATSLSGFVTGMVNVLIAGVISPALSHSHVWLSFGMASLLVTGFACWYSYRRLSTRTTSTTRTHASAQSIDIKAD
jgi:DHA1 family bicyclomycin/chloramphenicol resistance-like MFS transporter